MENVFGTGQWQWIQLNENEQGRISDEQIIAWLDDVRKNKTNYLRVNCFADEEPVVNGSLIYKQNISDEQDYKIIHFYLTEKLLVTVNLDWSELKQITPDRFVRQIRATKNAVEGFLLFLGEVINELLVGIDKFEEELKTLVWSVRKRNETGILEKVYHRRHELLVCKNLLIPINEVKMAIDEMGYQGIRGSKIFQTISKRTERIMVLLNEYEHQLDSMINLEEVISSHRGNEIMKTLTVMTTIFTPIMAFGALWGMNFKHMPELDWRYGYSLSIIIILISTILLYVYLKMKGWTGDLLKGKKRGSFFK
ncbi:magnesium transporter CorA family protein [Neobacillus dielmonensis]|uniref:magnesium transporter CorA family protein n=1 Tax=Neobacillus dielmonensis TaxID=1347369 RepID=UPI0005A95F9D|nr:magnesium transporter CorA family protein [Neobacillus dielmonensis]